MSIYISGSMAYDRIMNFPGKFTDSILPDQLHTLNVSFFIDRLDEKLGGNAGNIAHSLFLLGELSYVIATVGKDSERYVGFFQERGLPTEGIRILDSELTASAYITTDQMNNQITAFHAAAMMTPSGYTFPRLAPKKDLAIICPSNPSDMRNHPGIYQEKGVRYIYDPSQQLPVLTREDLLFAIRGAYLLAGNDYEIQLIQNITGCGKEELLGMTGAGIVTTLGEKGSLISHKDGSETHVGIVPIRNMVDPTGAGDAYRAGLLKGLVQGSSLVAAARLGATCASYCIESYGTQGHNFTYKEFMTRHVAAFGEAQ